MVEVKVYLAIECWDYKSLLSLRSQNTASQANILQGTRSSSFEIWASQEKKKIHRYWHCEFPDHPLMCLKGEKFQPCTELPSNFWGPVSQIQADSQGSSCLWWNMKNRDQRSETAKFNVEKQKLCSELKKKTINILWEIREIFAP